MGAHTMPLSKVKYIHATHSRAVHTYKLVSGMMAVTSEGDQGVMSEGDQRVMGDERGRPGSDERWQ